MCKRRFTRAAAEAEGLTDRRRRRRWEGRIVAAGRWKRVVRRDDMRWCRVQEARLEGERWVQPERASPSKASAQTTSAARASGRGQPTSMIRGRGDESSRDEGVGCRLVVGAGGEAGRAGWAAEGGSTGWAGFSGRAKKDGQEQQQRQSDGRADRGQAS